MNTYPIRITCTNCKSPIAFKISADKCDTVQIVKCEKCNTLNSAKIPDEKTLIALLNKGKKKQPFETDYQTEGGGTVVGGIYGNEKLLKLETVPNAQTGFQSFIVDQDFMSLGRKNEAGQQFKPDLEIVTEDKYISKIHCAIQRKANKRYVIKDLDSKNKTWLNGQALDSGEEIYLNHNDEIKIGRSLLKVTFVGASNSPTNQNKSNRRNSDDTELN